MAFQKTKQSRFVPPLSASMEENIQRLRQELGSPSDFVSQPFDLGDGRRLAVVFVEGLVNKQVLEESVIKRLLACPSEGQTSLPQAAEEIPPFLKKHVISIENMTLSSDFVEIVEGLLVGKTLVLVDQAAVAILVDTKLWLGRNVEEPITEALIRGPRDGFTENIRINTALIRYKIRDSNLRMESFKVGTRSHKDLVLIYMEGITNPDLVAEARRRIESIDIDDVPESGYVEQWIEDNFLSPFPQITSTERPDRMVHGLLNGQIAILLDGTPFGLIAPTTILNALRSPEDYYERWFIGTLLRLLRFIAAVITIFLTAGYIALVSYHPGMIPSELAFSFATARQGVPFPAVMEAFILEAAMELMREAGVRLPKPIGQTLGIVGGLVIGEALVKAGIVSPIMVIVVATTAVASFSLPYYGLAISFRLMRFATMFGAATLGIFGIILAYIMINIHVANLYSFGVSYAAPIAPSYYRDWRDTLIRAPLLFLSKRPKMMHPQEMNLLNRKGGKR